jgi:hypothetical protein
MVTYSSPFFIFIHPPAMVKLLCIILTLFAFYPCQAQRQLTLIQQNKIVTRFSEGDHIRFQRKDRDYFSSGKITGISQEYFKMGDEDTTYLYQIKRIDLRGLPNSGFKTAEIGPKLMMAGALLILVEVLNKSNGSGTDTSLIVVSTALVGSGIIMLFVNNRYFKIGGKKRVIVMK